MASKASSKRFSSSKLEASKDAAFTSLKFWEDNHRQGSAVLSPKTQAAQDQLWEDWRWYVLIPSNPGSQRLLIYCSYLTEVLQEDPEKVWLDLCDGLPRARNICLVFLEACVDNSKVLRPTLGSEEYAEVQTITSANAVLKIWKALLARADRTVLNRQRQHDPKNRSHWTLRYSSRQAARNTGPAYDVGSVR